MPSLIPDCPKYLQLKAGGLRPHPKAVDKALRCPQCGAFLGRSDSGYVCPKSLSHTRIIPAAEFEEKLAQASKLPKEDAGRLVVFLRRRARHMLRLGLGDDHISPRAPKVGQRSKKKSKMGGGKRCPGKRRRREC